jgi:hypothetical protein
MARIMKDCTQFVGLEFEGAYKHNRDISGYDRDMHSDGSVRVSGRYDINGNTVNSSDYYDTEIVSKKLKVDEIDTWVNKYYPDKWNKTCGLHIHVSFKKDYYSFLVSREFHDYMYEEIEKWVAVNDIRNKQFLERLRNTDSSNSDGSRNYCRKMYNAPNQYFLSTKDSARYCGINFAFSIHGTIEYRFPCFFKEKTWTIKMIHYIIESQERWLKQFLNKTIINSQNEIETDGTDVMEADIQVLN